MLHKCPKLLSAGLPTLIAMMVTLASCGTVPSVNTEEIRIGMSKAEVIELTGGPKRTFRENGKDNWVYVTGADEKQWLQVFTFANGKVVKIGKPFVKDIAVEELEDTNSLEEFEAKAKAIQKSRANNSKKFKNVDGSP